MIRYLKKLIPVLLVLHHLLYYVKPMPRMQISEVSISFGLETEAKLLQCTWAHSVEWHLDLIHSLDFNSIRLPFSVEYIMEGNFHNMDEFFSKIEQYPDILLPWTSTGFTVHINHPSRMMESTHSMTF